MTLEDWLKKYYRQLHFNSMKPEVRARFQELIKKDSLTDTMRTWISKYMHQDADGNYVQNDIPDTTLDNEDTGLPDDLARELFITCQNAFVEMNGAVAVFGDTDPQSKQFVNQYFGPGSDKLFNIAPASQDCEKGIQAIINLIKTNSNAKLYVENIKDPDDENKKLFATSGKLDEFIGKCDRKEYNTKGGTQAKVKKLARALNYALLYNQLSTELYGQIYPISADINHVVANSAFSMDPAQIDQDKLRRFKENIKENTGILQTLYKNKTIRSRFNKYDDGTITSIISEKAEDEIDYQKTDSDNYLKPKYEDVLNPVQQVEKWCKDTYNDTLRKYEELRGGHLFFSNEAKDICKAIDKVSDKTEDPKNKIKPVNGLSKLLERAEDVKKKLDDNPVAKQHFTWFVETMNAVKDDIPKAIDGCWKNSWQMKCVIEKIILKATDPNNDDPHAMEKAKTAMEIMTTMKFGMMTSKIMDAMKQTDFTVFSDGKLSWNKNEGIQFVTKAFDKSVKAAFLGVGYGVTFARNKIMMSDMKFKDKNNEKGPLGERMNEERARLASLNNTERTQLQQEIQDKRNEKTQNEQTLQNFANQGVTQQTIDQDQQTKDNLDATINQYKSQMDTAKEKMDEWQHKKEEQQEKMDALQKQKEKWQKSNDIINNVDLTKQIIDLNNQINNRNQKIQDIEAILNAPQLLDPATNNPITDPRAAGVYKAKLYKHLAELRDENRQNIDARTEASNQIANPDQNRQQILTDARNTLNNLNQANADYDQAERDFQQADTRYMQWLQRYNTLETQSEQFKQQNNYDALSDRITQFNDARDSITEANTVLAAKEAALQNWDSNHANKLKELEDFWNFLQTGKAKTWGLSTKRAQTKFDINKEAMLDSFVARHGMAA